MIKVIDDKEYEVLVDWWNRHKFANLPKQFLPSTGYIAYINDIPIVAGFLYIPKTGKIGWVEWVVKNPDSTLEEMDIGYKELMDTIINTAKEDGVDVLFVSLRNKSYQARLEDVGFFVTDENATNMLLNIGG